MRSQLITIFTGLLSAAVVTAAPNNGLFARQGNCPSDLCLRGVRGRGAAGVSDCSSFLATTVTSCGGITTTTVTITTATDTSTIVQTSSAVTSAGAGGTATVTTTVGTIAAGPGGPGSPGQPGKRQANCTPTTRTASVTPTYASACGGATSRYLTACSCVGVSTGTTTIVNQPTSTVTTTLYVLATTTVTRTTTVVSTVGSASTTVVQTVQPTSGNFQIILPGGRRVGIASDGSLQASGANGVVVATFFLNTRGELVSGTRSIGTDGQTGLNRVVAVTGAAASPLRCTLSNPPSGGALVCRVSASQRFPNLRFNQFLYLANNYPGNAGNQEYSQIDLFAVGV